jgi:hypothetical protein
MSKHNRRTAVKILKTRDERGAFNVLTEHRKHPVFSSTRKKCYLLNFLSFNLFIPLILPFFSVYFSFLLLSFFFAFTICCLQTIQLVVYSTSFLYYSQLLYPLTIPDNSTLLHKDWTISLHARALLTCSPHTSLHFSPPHLLSFLFPSPIPQILTPMQTSFF